ncbi:MAG: alpha/beta hydrolase [Williamsia sp.]|nr:alpha/beta hydrolase [Williamsia sp.]
MNNRLLITTCGIVIVTLWIAGCQPSTVDRYGDDPKAGQYASVRGIKMYYEQYGSGQPLLLLHANGMSIQSFSNQIPYFSKEYKVIAVDSRAQGKSMDAGDSLNYEMMADDFNALLDHLHLDSCYVIGWSDGAINALLLAMRHPEKVKKMAITGANLWPDTTAIDPFIFHWLAKEVDSLSKSTSTPENKNRYKLMYMMTKEPNISLQQLKSVKCPALVIGGDHDALLPRHTLQIAESIPQSYLWILPHSGHATPITYNKEFNETVRDFFKKPYKPIEGLDRFN